jgi:hypothetical protein
MNGDWSKMASEREQKIFDALEWGAARIEENLS